MKAQRSYALDVEAKIGLPQAIGGGERNEDAHGGAVVGGISPGAAP